MILMPILTIKELEDFCPFFKGRFGNAFGHKLMNLLSVEKVNNLYDRHLHQSGPDFASAVLNDIGVHYEVIGEDVLKRLPEGPFITISNHPYGSIDGVMLVDIFGHLRPDFKVMANRFLGRIVPLEENFICVTPTGNERSAPSNESIHGIKDAVRHLRSGHPIGIFPSGAVSDLCIKEFCIKDREWQEPVIRFIKKMRVPIVPVHFLDRNSDFYYSLGLINWRVRLLRLPAEVFNKQGKRTRVAVGEIISPQMQDSFEDMVGFSDFLRNKVYKQF